MFFFYSMDVPMCVEPPPETSPLSFSQGIRGKVTQLSGDYMPGRRTETAETAETSFRSVQTTIWIFRDRISSPGSPRWPVSQAQQHPQFEQKVESNAEGHYEIALPPGEYTVLAQYKDYLYLNAFQADGSFQSVLVAEDTVVDFDLVNTENATF